MSIFRAGLLWAGLLWAGVFAAGLIGTALQGMAAEPTSPLQEVSPPSGANQDDASQSSLGSVGSETVRPRNVVVVTIDTLRPDRLGCYGHDAPAVSPHLDALAARGTRFEHAWGTAPWTLPSVTSLFTGLRPDAHRADHFLAPVATGATLLAERCQNAGLTTIAIVGNYFLQAEFGLSRGFEFYNNDCLVDRRGLNSQCISQLAIDWLTTDAEPGFFMYLHYFDPHYNYLEHLDHPYGGKDTRNVRAGADIWQLRDARPNMDDADRARLRGLYDGEVAFTDEQIGRVFDTLRALDWWDETLIIVTADHGEALDEHGWIGHTIGMYEEQTRVPLIIAGPGVEPGVRPEPAQLTDIFPTLVEAFGWEEEPDLEGRSLWSLCRTGETSWTERPILLGTQTRVVENPRGFEEIAKRRSIVKGDWKLLVDAEEDGSHSYRIFDTSAPKGLRKKEPEDFPEKVQELLQAIEDDHAHRVARWQKAEDRRLSMAADARALVLWPWKLVSNRQTDKMELFDLEHDPSEQHDRAAEEPERVAAMHARLLQEIDSSKARVRDGLAEIDPEKLSELKARLEALGYVR